MDLLSIICLVLLMSLGFVEGSSSDCRWYANDGFFFDLSHLYGHVLWKEYSKWNFTFSPCQDGTLCSNSICMANQINTDESSCTAYLAMWNSTVKPKKISNGYSLTYRNGKSGCDGDTNRIFIAKFECGNSNYKVTDVSESATCQYTMKISTKYACNDGSNGEISVGSIMLIVFCTCLFLYCVIGYGISVKRNPENGWLNVKANTPHLSFWCMVTKWTWAGCCVTKEFIIDKTNQIRKREGYGDDYENVD